MPAAHAGRTDDTLAQTQPVVRKKERSTKQSVAILLGATAAGAAIGAATGGGKGAAIGAISGGAGGYVYDRMTRRNRVTRSNSTGGVPTVIDRDTDSPFDADQYRDDREPSLARQFGTPSFSGR